MSQLRMDGAPLHMEHCSICVHGRLAPRWAQWFDGLTMTYTDAGNTVISGAVADQAALHGLLDRVLDSHLTLISVNTAR